MMKTGYSLLLAIMMFCTSGSPLAAAETAPRKAPDQTKITQTVQSLEKRVSKLEADPHFSFEAQNRLIDKSQELYEARLNGFDRQMGAQQASISREISVFMAAAGAFLAFLTLLATLFGPKAIKGWIDDKANKMTKDRLDELITEEAVASILQPKIDTISEQFLQEFRKNAEEEIEKIHDLRKEIEALPKTLGEALTDMQKQAVSKVDEVAEEKSDDERTADDWFAIGLKADQEGRAEDAYRAFLKVMDLEETATSIGNAALAAGKAGQAAEAEEMYKRAIEADPEHANNLGNYATFLEEQERHDEAEAMYKRTIEADPEDVNKLGRYATFLTNVRGVYEEAEAIYKRAIEVDPEHAITLGNYAQILLAQGRQEGKGMLRQALALEPDDDLLAELNFYRFAHFPDKDAEALVELKRLLMEGVRSKGWDFAPNIERAIKDGHPNPELLQALADVISKGAPLDGLDKFAEWKAA